MRHRKRALVRRRAVCAGDRPRNCLIHGFTLEEIVDLVVGHAIDILVRLQRRAIVQVCGRNLADQLCRSLYVVAKKPGSAYRLTSRFE